MNKILIIMLSIINFNIYSMNNSLLNKDYFDPSTLRKYLDAEHGYFDPAALHKYLDANSRKLSEFSREEIAAVFNFKDDNEDVNDEMNIHDATKNGDIDIVRLLLEEDPGNVNSRDEDGNIPAHLAAVYSKKNIAELLINSGANVNIANNKGTTPLHNAQTPEITELLLNAGAEVDAQDIEGWTPLYTAVYLEQKAKVQLLIDDGANVNIINLNGDTPLHAACGNKDIAEMLLVAGADKTIRNNKNETALEIAEHTDFHVANLIANY